MLWFSPSLIIMLNCIWLYKGAYSVVKTAALANARQIHKLYRRSKSTEFELQQPWDFWPMSLCVQVWCDTCTLLGGHFCSNIMDGYIRLAKSCCCSGCICIHMWLLEQGCHAVNAMHCDSMHSAFINGYKEYSPQLWRYNVVGRGSTQLTEGSWAD